MVQGEANGRQRTIALFDVDGTLTVPRKVRMSPRARHSLSGLTCRIFYRMLIQRR